VHVASLRVRILLQIVCSAAENSDVPLRRTEKNVLNRLNKAAASVDGERPGQSFLVRESRETKKIKQRISLPWEKLFILVWFKSCGRCRCNLLTRKSQIIQCLSARCQRLLSCVLLSRYVFTLTSNRDTVQHCLTRSTFAGESLSSQCGRL
jgi:hypothetical protein